MTPRKLERIEGYDNVLFMKPGLGSDVDGGRDKNRRNIGGSSDVYCTLCIQVLSNFFIQKKVLRLSC